MSLLNKLRNYLGLAWAYTKLNWKTQLEYRGAFVSQVFSMIFNNCIWVAFWSLYFTRFQVGEGWGASDVIILWAVSAAGFGIAHTLCGNSIYLPGIIARGELDVWLLYPRAILSHIVVGRMCVSSVGDTLFGYVVYLAFVRPDLPHFLMFVFLTFSVAILFLGFSIFSSCLGFYLGNAESLAEQWRFAMITFSLYPAGLFKGAVKVILFTLIPAAFVNQFPIDALRSLSLVDAGIALLGSLSVLGVAILTFYHGLSRYESGNAIGLRG